MSYRAILVVDDDEKLRRMLTFFFVKKGFKVVSAKDGIDAIKILGRLRPDIILLDLAMPDMDGFEFCTRIKKDALWAEIPLIVISALPAAYNRERVLSLGVSDYFEKPFVSSELMDRVTKLLNVEENVFGCNSGVLNYKGGGV